MLKKIAVFGKGGFGREVQMLIEQINANKPEWEFIGFFDDAFEPGEKVNGADCLGGIDELNAYDSPLNLVLAIGSPKAKEAIISKITNSLIEYPVLIHPNVQLGSSEWLKIGEGTIITAGCIITVNIEIGKHVILNLSCTVGHDTVIGDYCSFMPTVNISGEVVLEKGVYVGTGAKIINQLSIGSNTTVGAGAVVAKTLPANCIAVGVPAKPIKFIDQ